MQVMTIQSEAFQELIGKIDRIKVGVQEPPKEKWIDNQEFIQLLKISKRTAQHYRDSGLISFSQIGNKLYYKLSDIEELLIGNYNLAYKERRKTTEYFSQNDLVDFGKYLLSDKRQESIKNGHGYSIDEDFIKQVCHADIENWKVNQVDEYVDGYMERMEEKCK